MAPTGGVVEGMGEWQLPYEGWWHPQLPPQGNANKQNLTRLLQITTPSLLSWEGPRHIQGT